jgi:hypothetical protein
VADPVKRAVRDYFLGFHSRASQCASALACDDLIGRHERIHKGVSAPLGVLRCLFAVDHVVPYVVADVRRVEAMGSAGIDYDLEVG